MKRFFKILRHFFIFVILTIFTQVGGIVYLIHIFVVGRMIKTQSKIKMNGFGFLVFILIYSLVSFVIVPPIAKRFNRVPLPVFSSKTLKPLTLFTCISNRHYVTQELRSLIIGTAVQVNSKFKGSTIYYLDANFPLIHNFPLLPHLSHKDGRKLDLAFFYKDKKSDTPLKRGPSLTGYGIFVKPKKNEINQTVQCKKQGDWQYDATKLIGWGLNKSKYKFDMERTRYLIKTLLSQTKGTTIFIEPHLKKRMNLSSYDKVKYQGCHAVRHDDHIHLQFRK